MSIYGRLEQPVWELTVIGNRQKEREVPFSIATLEASKTHWAHQGQDFMLPMESGPLLSAVMIALTPASRTKHY
jgi:hypothetical protein